MAQRSLKSRSVAFWRDLNLAKYIAGAWQADFQSDCLKRRLFLYLVYTIGLENYGRIATFAFDAYINRLAARPRGQSFLMQRFI